MATFAQRQCRIAILAQGLCRMAILAQRQRHMAIMAQRQCRMAMVTRQLWHKTIGHKATSAQDNRSQGNIGTRQWVTRQHRHMARLAQGNIGTWQLWHKATSAHGKIGTRQHRHMATLAQGNIGTWQDWYKATSAHGKIGTWQHRHKATLAQGNTLTRHVPRRVHTHSRCHRIFGFPGFLYPRT